MKSEGNADVQCIRRTISGDTNAFSQLVEKYQGVVIGLAFHHVQNMQDAEDIAQEVFLKAYQHLTQLKAWEKFPSWLRKMTDNACNTWLRLNHKKRQTLELEETLIDADQKSPDAVLIGKTTSETIQRAIQELSEANRLAVTLFYMSELSYKEVSGFLGISIEAVKGRLHKARQQLKKGLWTMVEDTFSQKTPKEEITRSVMDAIAVGRVIATSGKPVQGAAIQVRSHDGSSQEPKWQTLVHTDVDGEYAYPLSAPENSIHTIRARHQDFESLPESRFIVETSGEVGVTDLVMKPTRAPKIHGRVTNALGEPIEGARLSSIYHHLHEERGNTAATDSAGHYTIENWTESYPLLFAKADGYTAEVADLDVSESDTLSADFVLRPAVETRGKVIDTDGQPIKRVYLGFNYPRQRHGLLDPWSTRTDADGLFRISGLPEGPMRMLVTCNGYHDIRWRNITAGQTGIEVVMQRIETAQIAGEVIDATTGAPLMDFTYFADYPDERSTNQSCSLPTELRLEGCRIQSDDGAFTIDGLPTRAEADIVITAHGYAPVRICNVRAMERWDKAPIKFALQEGQTVFGCVVDAETMQPVENARVRHFCAVQPLIDMLPDAQRTGAYGRRRNYPHAKRGGQSVVTDGEGRFTLNTVGNSGSYLFITPPDEPRRCTSSVVGPIEFHGAAQDDQMFVLLYGGGTVRGTAPELSPDRQKMRTSCSGETVWLVSKDIPHLTIDYGVVLDETRTFTFEHVMPGKWQLEHYFHDEEPCNDWFEPSWFEEETYFELENGETVIEPFEKHRHQVVDAPETRPEKVSFGTICRGAIVEARLVLRGVESLGSFTVPKWIGFDRAQRDDFGRYNVYVTADTNTVGAHLGEVRFQTDVGELAISASISVIEPGAERKKVLWTATPFDGFNGTLTDTLDRLISSHDLDVDFTHQIPTDLEPYDAIVLHRGCLLDVWSEDVQRLHAFVEAGGRLILGADAFYRGTVRSVNQIVRPYGLEMADMESYREVNVKVSADDLQTDWQRDLFADIANLEFFRPSPIVVRNRDALCLRHPDDENLVYLATVRENGQITLIGQSLLLKFFSTYENERFLRNLLL